MFNIPKQRVTLPVLNSAHQVAEQFSQSQSSLLKSEQVYLNTLAVFTVSTYLEELGWETRLEASDSWNSTWQTLMNVADLQVNGCGKLECRTVIPGAETVDIPAEVWQERIGYVAVQFNESLDEAQLLGFVKRVETEAVPIDALQSIDELLAHLSQVSLTPTIDPLAIVLPIPLKITRTFTHLNQWLQGEVTSIWQTIDQVFSPQQVSLNWRTRSNEPSRGSTIQQVKVLEFGNPPYSKQVALIIEITPVTATEMEIDAQVRSITDHTYLPSEIEIKLLDECGTPLSQHKEVMTEIIQFQFSGQLGEQFSIEVTLGDRQIVETFVI